MSMEVLQTKEDVQKARRQMRQKGIDLTDSWISVVLKKYNILPGIGIGDVNKSWDVLKTVRFIEEQVDRSGPVIDLGAYRCEVLPILHKLGYMHLTGIDLNPQIAKMPQAGSISYIESDFMNVPLPDESFSAVTAISVIEHGFCAERLLKEVSRLLKPGGYFIASVDYWPEKICTDGIRAYDMDWQIFSQNDLTDFFAEAEQYGFNPVGDLNFTARDRTTRWMGKEYTFAWFVLKKS